MWAETAIMACLRSTYPAFSLRGIVTPLYKTTVSSAKMSSLIEVNTRQHASAGSTKSPSAVQDAALVCQKVKSEFQRWKKYIYIIFL